MVDRSPSFPFPVDPNRKPESSDGVHRAAFRGAIGAADAYHATRAAIRVEGTTLRLGNRFVRLPRYREVAFIAVGNAAASQAFAVTHALGERLTQGFVAGPDPVPEEVPFRSVRVPRGPPGSKEGEEATQLVLELGEGLDERDLLVVLVSPGALPSLALPPPGMTGAEFGRWLEALHSAGATSRETSLVAASLGQGSVDGGLAGAVRGAEVVTVVLDRGDGGALVGGSPSWRLGADERAQARRAAERLGLLRSLPVEAQARLGPRPDLPKPLPRSVGRPVVGSDPADALRGAADSVGEKRYVPRLARVTYSEGPEEAAAAFVARLDAILAAEPGLLKMTDRDGVAVLAGATLGVPDGFDERPAIRAFLRAAGPLLRYRGTTVGAYATSGGEDPGDPPAVIVDVPTAGQSTPPPFRGLGMRSGITDVGCILVAVVPSRPPEPA
jgi:hypothetical protein